MSFSRADRACRDLIEAVDSALADGVSEQRVINTVYGAIRSAAERRTTVRSDAVAQPAPADEHAPVAASPFNVRRDEHGGMNLYVGDAWVVGIYQTPVAVDNAGSVEQRRTALNEWIAATLRPLFDGSVVTR